MLKKKKLISIIFILLLFIAIIPFLLPKSYNLRVTEITAPNNITLNKGVFKIEDYDCFDDRFTKKNEKYASDLSITEEEAFIMGNLGKYWAENLLKGRKVYISKSNDLIYYKYGYKTKFYYSGFCLKDGKPCFKDNFEKKLYGIGKGNYKVFDTKTGKIYDPSAPEVRKLETFLVIRKSHLPKTPKKPKKSKINSGKFKHIFSKGQIKIFFADSTSKIKPDRSCSSDICKEILSNINSAQKTIDIAIYGYSDVPAIKTALKNALERGVKIRLVYDLNAKGENIYPDTSIITNLLKDNKSDKNSPFAENIMHNKFYIFDDKILITGSANLSHTDMSGFNTNNIIVINSPEIARIYKQEFEQMYNGKFHNEKTVVSKNKIIIGNTELEIYFSPKDKAAANAILPIINGAKRYIYIPVFVMTDKRIVAALSSAKSRGVDIRIIVDALNASAIHSKHKELRSSGIPVKTENYAGKMHSKSIIVDDTYTIIGSMNFSNSGENKNDENLILIKDYDITNKYKEFFLYQWGRIDDKWLKLNVRAEGKDSIGSCSDGIDNNYDGLIDSADEGCK